MTYPSSKSDKDFKRYGKSKKTTINITAREVKREPT